MAAAELVDWGIAARVARAVAGSGPPVAPAARAQIRHDFEEFVRVADGLVSDFTGLRPPEPAGTPVVLDRSGWVGANVEGFRALLRPLGERFAPGQARGIGRRIGQTAIGFQIGILLGYLAQKVLGQYDLVLASGGAGRVYFVAPNVVGAERRWRFAPRDFRLWIALHEVTHRTQFAAVPWLRDYVAALIGRYLSSVEFDARRLREAVDNVRQLLARGPQAWRGANLLTLFLSPAQQEVVAQMQSLMCVVEGHGNFVMDRVGAERIPTFGAMKEALRAQRSQTGVAERTLQRAMGLDMKYAQYRLGESFVETVAGSSGMEGVNLVWERAENLPTMVEIRDPKAWLARVLRGTPPPAGPG